MLNKFCCPLNKIVCLFINQSYIFIVTKNSNSQSEYLHVDRIKFHANKETREYAPIPTYTLTNNKCIFFYLLWIENMFAIFKFIRAVLFTFLVPYIIFNRVYSVCKNKWILVALEKYLFKFRMLKMSFFSPDTLFFFHFMNAEKD